MSISTTLLHSTITYSSANGSSVTSTMPAGYAVGDLLLCVVGTKPDTATAVINTAGWTLAGSAVGGGGTTGVDAGPTRVMAYYKVATSASETAPVATLSGNSVSWIQTSAIRATSGQYTVAAVGGADSTTGTAVSILCGSNPDIAAGDLCFIAMCDPTDISHTYASVGVSATGVTAWGASTVVSQPRSSVGNDIGGFTAWLMANTGSSTGAPTITATASGTTTNVRGPGILVRVRETVAVQQNNMIDGVEPEAVGGSQGPIMDSNGNLYRVTEEFLNNPATGTVTAGYGNHPMMMKSSDGGVTWSRMDATNSPGYGAQGSFNDLESAWIVHRPTRKEIVLLYMKSQSRWWGVIYRTSDHATNPDTWDTSTFGTSSGVDTFSTTASESGIGGVRLSNGDVRAFVRGTPQNSNQAFLTRTMVGTTWGASSYITDTGINMTRPAPVVGESDTTYLFYRDHTNGQVRYRTVSSSGVVSASARVDSSGAGAGGATAYENNVLPPVFYMDGSTPVVVVAFINASNRLRTVEVRGGVVQAEQEVSTDTVTVDPLGNTSGTDNQGPSAAIAVVGTTIYAIWGDNTSGDLYWSKRNNGGAWQARQLLADTGTSNYVGWVYANRVTTPDGTNKVAYTYDVLPHADDDSNITYGDMVAVIPSAYTGTGSLSGTGTLSGSGVAATTQSAYDALVMEDGPVGYWPLRSDIGINLANPAKPATVYNSPTTRSLPNGDAALVFDGASQYAEIADDDAYSVSTTGQLTFEMVLAPDVLNFPNTETSGDGPIVYPMIKGTTYGASGDQEYVLRMYDFVSDRPNRMSGYLFNPDGGLGAGSYVQDTVTPGEPMHIAVAFDTVNLGPDGWGTVSIYKNGVLRDTDSLGDPYFITPENKGAPVHIGARPGHSWFQGSISKFAIHDHIVSAGRLALRAAALNAALSSGGIAYTRTVGTAQDAVSGTTLTVPVSQTIPVGHTLIVNLAHAYTSGGPSVTDSRGNTYTRDRTAANSGGTLRSSVFSAPITTALQAGDSITITLSAAVAAKAATVVEFSGLLDAGRLDVFNSGQAAASTTGTAGNLSTTNDNDLVVAMVGSLNPVTDTFTEADGYTQNARQGTNTGGAADTNVTVNSAHRIETTTGTFVYAPTFGTATDSVGVHVAYKAAPVVVDYPGFGSLSGSGTLSSTRAAAVTNTGNLSGSGTLTSGSGLSVAVPGSLSGTGALSGAGMAVQSAEATGTVSGTGTLTAVGEVPPPTATTYTIFDGAAVGAYDSDPGDVNLALEFSVSTTAWVTELKVYRPSTAMSGNVYGLLWQVNSATSGTLLVPNNLAFALGSTAGWKTLTLATPVQLTAGQRYRVGFWATNGYSASGGYFNATANITAGIITVYSGANATGQDNGSYGYSSTVGAFPTNSFNNSLYVCDLTVTDTDPSAPAGDSYSGLGSVAGSGSLSATGSAAVVSAAALSGTGSLTSNRKPSAAATGALSGAGTLSSAVAAAVVRTGVLNGVGTVVGSGSAEQAVQAAANLSGTGTLSTASLAFVAGAGALTGTGTLAGSGSTTAVNTGALSGTGSLSSPSNIAVVRTGTLSGTGTVVGSGQAEESGQGTANLTGAGTLSATGSALAIGVGTLSGTGSLSSSSESAVARSGNLTGAGTVTGTGNAEQSGQATANLSGTGTLSASGRASVVGVGVLSGTGTLAGIGGLSAVNIGAVSGTGSLTGNVKPGAVRAANLSGVGIVSGTGTATQQGTATGALSGSGTVSAGGSATVARSGVLSGSGALTSTGGGSQAGVGTGLLSGNGSLTTVTAAQLVAQSNLQGTGTLAQLGVSTFTRTVGLTGTGTLSSMEHVELVGAGALSGSGTVTAFGRTVRKSTNSGWGIPI